MNPTSTINGLNSTWEAIAERTKIFEQAMANAGAPGVTNCYTNDAEFMPSTQTLIAGKVNIQIAIAGYISQGFTKYKVISTTVWRHIEVVGVQASYTLSQQGGKNKDTGKTIQLWKQENGVWKIFRDCFNSDLPAPN